MLTLGQVRGQARVVELLQRALASGRVAQAYLFAGPQGCGKHSTGLALAKALNCLRHPNQGCDSCDACSKIDQGIHPDVRTLETQGAQARIPIETIRKEVIPALAMPPHEARARVFLIEEAGSMAGPAANALLKTLEEPPPRTHFILGSVAPVRLLPTIRSRCQRVNFQALPADLAASLRGDEDTADDIRNLCDAMLAASEGRGLVNILDAAKSASERATLLGALEQYAQHCHLAARRSIEIGASDNAKAYAGRALSALETLVAVRDHNAHGQLAVEHLLVATRGLAVKPVVSA